MIFAWLSARGLFGMAKGLWLVCALLAIMAAVVLLQKREQADDTANQNIGAAIQREGDLIETIERTGQANDARTEIERDLQTGDGRSAAVYVACLSNDRNPANCDRYRVLDDEAN